MNNKNDTGIVIKVHFKEDGADILDILKHSVMLFVEEEVKKLCCQAS